MTLAEFLTALRRGWLILLAATLLGLALAALVTATTIPRYQSTAQLLVSARDLGSTAPSTVEQQTVQTCVTLVPTAIVLEPVIKKLGLDFSPAALAEKITATSPADTASVQVAVDYSNGQVAAAIANAVADRLADVVEGLSAPAGGGERSFTIATVDSVAAVVPTAPKPLFNLLLGLLAGLAAGVAVVASRVLLRHRKAQRHS